MDPIIEKVIYIRGLSKTMSKSASIAANSFVDKLIKRNKLSDDIDLSLQKKDYPIMDMSDLFEDVKFSPWKIGLATLLARHFSCSINETSLWNNNKKIYRYRLVGRRKDMDFCRKSFFFLTKKVKSSSFRYQTSIEVKSYCEGMVAAIRLGLTNLKHEVKGRARLLGKYVDVAALEARPNKSNKVAEKISKNSVLKKVHTSYHMDYEAFDNGVKDGECLFEDNNLIKILKNII